jgi:hypothetical protein
VREEAAAEVAIARRVAANAIVGRLIADHAAEQEALAVAANAIVGKLPDHNAVEREALAPPCSSKAPVLMRGNVAERGAIAPTPARVGGAGGRAQMDAPAPARAGGAGGRAQMDAPAPAPLSGTWAEWVWSEESVQIALSALESDPMGASEEVARESTLSSEAEWERVSSDIHAPFSCFRSFSSSNPPGDVLGRSSAAPGGSSELPVSTFSSSGAAPGGSSELPVSTNSFNSPGAQGVYASKVARKSTASSEAPGGSAKKVARKSTAEEVVAHLQANGSAKKVARKSTASKPSYGDTEELVFYNKRKMTVFEAGLCANYQVDAVKKLPAADGSWHFARATVVDFAWSGEWGESGHKKPPSWTGVLVRWHSTTQKGRPPHGWVSPRDLRRCVPDLEGHSLAGDRSF